MVAVGVGDRARAWAAAVAVRAPWSGRPWFLAAVAVLAVNDHVLKARHPGWWTGKLSDVAGVAVVATLAAVVAGRRVGLPLTAVGFAALKVVPGVAELAAPILGGTTQRDATDLLGLLVLLPLWPALGAAARPTDRAPSPPAGWAPRASSSGSSRRRAGAAVLPVLGALTSLVATTATSCVPEPGVAQVAVAGTDAYARVGAGPGDRGWARSTDGGATWTRSAAPAGAATSASTSTVPTTSTGSSGTTTPTPAEPVEACGAAGCFRVRSGRIIERADTPAGPWVAELTYDAAELDDLDGPCAGPGGVLAAIAASDESRGPVLASLGASGVAVRQADGTWERQAVLGADHGRAGRDDRVWLLLVLAAAPVGLVGALLVGRKRATGRILGPLVAPLAVGLLVTVHVVRSFGGGAARFGPADLAIAVVAVVAGLAVARKVGSAPPQPTGPSGFRPGWPAPGRDPRPPPPAA